MFRKERVLLDLFTSQLLFRKYRNELKLLHSKNLCKIHLYTLKWLVHCYRPHTGYREGDVFTGVCHSVHRGRVHPRPPQGNQRAVSKHPTCFNCHLAIWNTFEWKRPMGTSSCVHYYKWSFSDTSNPVYQIYTVSTTFKCVFYYLPDTAYLVLGLPLCRSNLRYPPSP